MSEAGVEPLDVERRTRERDEWKKIVKERMEHLDQWVAQKGHEYEWSQGEERASRSQKQVGGLRCEYEGCGKMCKTRAGLTIHQKRMHREGEKIVFRCDRCGKEITTEGAKASHVRSCTGGGEGNRIECGRCGRWVSKSNYARHRRGCGGEEGAEAENGAEERRGGMVRGRTRACEECGKVITVRNMARHMDTQHRVWDPGGGPRP